MCHSPLYHAVTRLPGGPTCPVWSRLIRINNRQFFLMSKNNICEEPSPRPPSRPTSRALYRPRLRSMTKSQLLVPTRPLSAVKLADLEVREQNMINLSNHLAQMDAHLKRIQIAPRPVGFGGSAPKRLLNSGNNMVSKAPGPFTPPPPAVCVY